MKIFCDSSTKEACLVIEGIKEPLRVPYSKLVTSNVGEYKAVILALLEARSRLWKEVEILTDSQLVVKQINGDWKCRGTKHLLPFREEARSLFGVTLGDVFYRRKGWEVKWIPREENLAGKVLG